MKRKNWTDKEAKSAIADYQAGMEVSELAKKYNKTTRSVTCKLVHQGVFVNKSKQYSKRVTNKELVAEIESRLDIKFKKSNKLLVPNLFLKENLQILVDKCRRLKNG